MILTEFDAENISVNEVLIGFGRRSLNEDVVERLLASVRLIGLQTPISVRTDPDAIDPETGEDIGGYHLISGRHRLEAFRRLGRSDIPARVWKRDSDPVLVEMWEISENLHRAELTELERSTQVARWVELTEHEALSGQLAQKPTGGRPEGGLSAAVRELGIERTEARRSIKIAGLSDEAKCAALATGLDNNQSALLAAAKEKEPEKQVAVLQQKAETKAAAKASAVTSPVATTESDPCPADDADHDHGDDAEPNDGDHVDAAIAAIAAVARLQITGTAAGRDWEWSPADINRAKKALTWLRMFVKWAERGQRRYP